MIISIVGGIIARGFDRNIKEGIGLGYDKNGLGN